MVPAKKPVIWHHKAYHELLEINDTLVTFVKNFVFFVVKYFNTKGTKDLHKEHKVWFVYHL